MNYDQKPMEEVKSEEVGAARKYDLGIFNQRKTLENSFYIFPESLEENKVQKARAMLGEIAKDVPDEEISVYITQFQYLLDSWLDIYEKQIFSNLTLQELLREER